LKLLLVYTFSAFKFINLNTTNNRVKLVEPGSNGVSTLTTNHVL